MTLESLRARVGELEEKVEALTVRLDALTKPVAEENVRATLAKTLREIADDIDEELVPAPHHDPRDEEV